jgi:hypothetical protein
MSLQSFIARVEGRRARLCHAPFWFAFSVVAISHRPWVALAVAGLAAIKEFWFDARYEIPKQTFQDNFADWTGYIAGAAISAILITQGKL